ncbi:MAG: hypothetical protein IT429_24155 [Gemmataceae bacterium]|nr:hypothetical protein [Gemmataceae bacterium]
MGFDRPQYRAGERTGTDVPRYCFCAPDQPPWPARPDDRYCALCGRELLAVVPHTPLLGAGSPPLVVAYLHASESFCAGTFTLDLTGLVGAAPGVHWEPLPGPTLDLLDHRLVSPTALELSLWSDATPEPNAGCALLTVTLHGRRFPFEVRAYVVTEPRCRTRLSLGGKDEPSGSLLVIGRDLGRTTTYLEFEPGPGVPAAWGEIHCDHPAVAVTPLYPRKAQAPALAEVRWDPAWLRADGEVEEILFRVRPRALPETVFRQRVCRRLRRPLRFQPAVLAIDSLAEDAPETRLVRLTNEDTRPVVIREAVPQVPWIPGVELSPATPLRLLPGESATLLLSLHFQERTHVPPPYEGTIGLALAGRAGLTYPVRVEAVRPPQRLAGPLLIDPGPPRVVLANWEASCRRVAYLPSSGDGGIAPEDLGLSRRDYAEAVYGVRPAAPVLRFLVAAARTRCRLRDRLEVGAVRLCRQPWVPVDFAADGVEVSDPHGHAPAGTRVVRFDVWNSYLCAGPGSEPVPLLLPGEAAPAPGSGALRWLGQRYAEALRTRRRAVPVEIEAAARGADLPPHALWMRLACEALALDYRWGPAYAWRRLLCAWRAEMPDLGPPPFTPVVAHLHLTICAADYARQVGAALLRQGLAEAAGGVAIVGPLLHGRLFADVLRSMLGSGGLGAACVAASWAEWFAPPAAATESA